MGELRQRGKVWWVRYYRAGRRYEESAHSEKKQAAIDLLRIREGDVARGVPVTAKMNRYRFEDAGADLLNEYRINNRRSVDELERRLGKHLLPYFRGRRMSSITTADVRAYVAHRQEQGIVSVKGSRKGERVGEVSNGEINRELQHLKRAFSLAVQAEKILRRPHIPLLEERNTRAGFFELAMLRDVVDLLPAPLRPVVQFAYVTGWRIASEVLPLQWRQIDFKAGEIRLDPETTKNRAGRVFPMTDDLRALLKAQDVARAALQLKGQLCPWVFWRMVAKGRRGPKAPKPIIAFTKAWKTTCVAAGCPGRIPHDFRRTAIRNMVRRGVPERVAMQLAGHKTRSVFDRYNIVSEGDLRTAAAQLGGLMTGTIQGQSAPISGTDDPKAAGLSK
jgi:integrase